MSKVDAAELEQLLKLYYSRLFPYAPYIKWLSYGSPGVFMYYLLVAGLSFLKAVTGTVPYKILFSKYYYYNLFCFR